MKRVGFVVKIIIILGFLTSRVYSQSIGFDQLINEQVRSDYYSPEWVTIPTDYHYQTSIYAQNWYEQLIVWDGSNTEIGNYSTRGDNEIPDLYVGPGVYKLELKLFELNYGAPHFVEKANCIVTIEEKYVLKAINNFGGGLISLDGTEQNGMISSQKAEHEGMTVSSIDQQYNGIDYAWSESSANPSIWGKRNYATSSVDDIIGATTRTYTYMVEYGDNQATIIAGMKKKFSISIQNFISGQNNRGMVSINDVQHSSPHTTSALEGDQVKLTATDYDENGMHYVFNHWEDGSTSATRNVNIGSNATYTAYYKGTPIYTSISRNLLISNAVRSYPVLTWNEHSNPLVTSYKIYRQVLKGPHADQGSQIGEVSRGTLTFTDIDYYNLGTQNQEMLMYDVEAYCASENTSSDQCWCGLFFGVMVKQGDSVYAALNKKNLNLEYSLSNYPNPFNPSTQIMYSIKEGGLVTLQIYDILGNKVADLVREYQPAGSYSASFNAGDRPSGIYICTIKVNNYKATKKILLVK